MKRSLTMALVALIALLCLPGVAQAAAQVLSLETVPEQRAWGSLSSGSMLLSDFFLCDQEGRAVINWNDSASEYGRYYGRTAAPYIALNNDEKRSYTMVFGVTNTASDPIELTGLAVQYFIVSKDGRIQQNSRAISIMIRVAKSGATYKKGVNIIVPGNMVKRSSTFFDFKIFPKMQRRLQPGEMVYFNVQIAGYTPKYALLGDQVTEADLAQTYSGVAGVEIHYEAASEARVGSGDVETHDADSDAESDAGHDAGLAYVPVLQESAWSQLGSRASMVLLLVIGLVVFLGVLMWALFRGPIRKQD